MRIEGVLHREDLDAVAALALARYSARSASRISRVGSGASSGNTAMPKAAVTRLSSSTSMSAMVWRTPLDRDTGDGEEGTMMMAHNHGVTRAAGRTTLVLT